MYGLILVRLHYQRLKHHAFVPVQQSEHHIQMYERLRLRRQLLHNHIAAPLRTASAETFYHEIDALRGCPDTVSYNHYIIAGYYDVTSFHYDRRVLPLKVIRVNHTAFKRSAMTVNCIHDQ